MVLFDPDMMVLKTQKFVKPKEELLYQLEHAPTMLMKVAAALSLGKWPGDPAAVAALAATLKSGEFRGLREESARVLGRMGTDNARDVLLVAKDSDPRVRVAIADALGHFEDEKAAARLIELSRDRWDQVAMAALRNLGKTKSKKAFAALSAGLKRNSHNDMVRVGAWTGFKELKDARAVPVALKRGLAPQSLAERNAANACLAALYAETEKTKRGKVRDHFAASLRDVQHQIRRGSMEHLGTLEDPKAVSMLEEAVEREPLNLVARAGRQTLRKLKEKAAAKGDAKEFRREVESLREENRELRNRIAKLEETFGGKNRKKTS